MDTNYCAILKILYSCLKKETYKVGSFFYLVLSAAPNCLKNLSAAVNATKRAARILLKRSEPNVNFFCTKIVYFRLRTEQTDAL